MSCAVWNPTGCIAEVAQSAFTAFATSVAKAVGDMLQSMMTWWVRTNSIDMTGMPIKSLQDRTMPLVVLVATGAMMWAGAKMTFGRRPDPLVSAGQGLVRVILATGLGISLSAAALRLGDSISRWLLDAATQGQAAQRMGSMVDLTGLAGGSPALVIFMGMVLFVVSLAQWFLLMLRQAGIIFLAPLLPLAAATSMTPASGTAFRRVILWELSLLAYKPIVAFVYLVGFQVFGQSTGVEGVMVGATVLVLAVVAMPALLRFFSWAVDPQERGLHDGGRVMGGVMLAMTAAQSASAFSSFLSRVGPGTAGAAAAAPAGAPSGAGTTPAAAPAGGPSTHPSGSTGTPAVEAA